MKSEDPKAKVEVNLDKQLVMIESSLSQDEIAQQITEAGYTPTAGAA